MDTLHRREIQSKNSGIDESQRKWKKSILLNISDENANFRVRFSDFDAFPTRTASQKNPKKSQTSQLDTAGYWSHIMKDVCVAKIDKNQNWVQGRHYSAPRPYTSSAILHRSTGGPSLIDEATINTRTDCYN